MKQIRAVLGDAVRTESGAPSDMLRAEANNHSNHLCAVTEWSSVSKMSLFDQPDEV